MLPAQSIVLLTRTPLSLSFMYAQMVPNRPKGTDTKKTKCHSMGARTPPRIRPRNDPVTSAIPLMPMALPRSSSGKASVRMALELANRKAPPTPWPRRIRMIQIAAPLRSSR